MLQINFYPECDNPVFEKAAEEYGRLWHEEEERIVATIEEVSGLKFRETIINAIVYDRSSYSKPLSLEAKLSKDDKKEALIHEICHRLLLGNKIRWEKLKGKHASYLISHKPLDLILYDILVKLYGKNFAKKSVETEINEWQKWGGIGVSPYKLAWDWALAMSGEDRQREFKKYLL